MANTGRKLNVLVIHDTNFPRTAQEVFGTDELHLCEVQIRAREDVLVTMPQLLSWKDTMNLLRSWSGSGSGTEVCVSEPDVLLIDCHFDADRSAPPLVPVDGKRPVDARGLLYGSVLAAYFVGRRPDKAFGFAIYSENLPGAAEDPYALTMFGLLEALSGNMIPVRKRAAVFRERMLRGEKYPHLILPRALESFRASLLRTFEYRIQPDIESFQNARAVIARAVDGEEVQEDADVAWDGADGKTTVRLKSLFADCVQGGGQWSAAKCRDADALTYLDSILTNHNSETLLVQPAVRNVNTALESVPGQVSWSVGIEGYRQKVLSLLMLWAINRCKVRAGQARHEHIAVQSIGDLDTALGLSAKEMNRALGRVLGNYDQTREDGERIYPGKEFLEKLDGSLEWPYPGIGWMRAILTRDLDRRLIVAQKHKQPEARFLEREVWPRCLRD